MNCKTVAIDTNYTRLENLSNAKRALQNRQHSQLHLTPKLQCLMYVSMPNFSFIGIYRRPCRAKTRQNRDVFKISSPGAAVPTAFPIRAKFGMRERIMAYYTTPNLP